MPIIAIPRCEALHDYEEAVRRSGGEPLVVVPETHNVQEAICAADGILLAGGNDVRPGLYGEPAHPMFKPSEPGRDEYELQLARHARIQHRPLFGICRGIQVLNVARGGTLIQDIRSQTASSVDHYVMRPPVAPAHEVWPVADSLLASIVGGQVDSFTVNSRHHQAVGVVGEELIVTATAPDGIVESVEDPTQPFCLGVQWHPENFWRTGEFRPLFDAFIAACRQR